MPDLGQHLIDALTHALKRTAVVLMLAIMATIVLCIGLAYLFAAIHDLFLMRLVDPINANLATVGVAIGAILVLGLMAWLVLRRVKVRETAGTARNSPPPAFPQSALIDAALPMLGVAESEIKAHPLTSIALAALAGAVTGSQPDLLAGLLRQLGEITKPPQQEE